MTNPLKPLPKIEYPGTAEAMIAVFSSQLGYSEVGNNDTYFGKWYGMNFEPWCAISLSWAAFVSGCNKVIPKHAATWMGAEWFQDRGLWHETPKVGAIVYYDTAGLGRISHVGCVDAIFSDGSWTAIEGNTNAAGSREGKVIRRQKRRTVGTSRGGFAYPKYAKIPKPTKTVAELSLEVIAGKWGSGAERINKLTKAGYSSADVQEEVNRIMKVSPNAPSVKKSNEELAREVLVGKWDIGPARVMLLTKAGYSAKDVQTEVNRILKG